MQVSNLPKLLYIGDVAVESTTGGSALLYRLLQKYPVNRLQIIEGNIAVSQPEFRLPEVVYQDFTVGKKRLLHSRLTPIYNSYLLATATQRVTRLIKTVEKFKPEAIITVTHGYSWLTAAKLAKQLAIPLHLIVHDDILSLTPVPSWYRGKFNEQLQNVYRQARSRLCVSPYMVESYSQRYDVTGSVLYPSRASNIQKFESPPSHLKQGNKSLTFAYAGSVHSPGQANTLITLASVLDTVKAKLVIYSPLTQEAANQIGLDRTNVSINPIIPSHILMQKLRESADVMFAPMDFDDKYKTHVKLCFPSKLTDYTAIGLPILIWGPSYCSAVRWAQENPGVAEVVNTKNVRDLEVAVNNLVNHPKHRYQLGLNALVKGHDYFDYDVVVQKFYQSIIKTVPKAEILVSR